VHSVSAVLDDERLRRGLSESGLQHAQAFSWERVADQVERALSDEAGDVVRD
jgi:glycosyltransferase involved in cell wall biosynthesis